MRIYKKCTAKPYSFLFNDKNLPSDDTLQFRKNILEWLYNKSWKLTKITDKKLQYNINGEAAKISALSSGKVEKYKYLTGEEILPSNQKWMIKQKKWQTIIG